MARATITRKLQITEATEPGEPLWRQGQAVNSWREIEGSSMSLCPPTVNPNNKNALYKMEAWCGFSIDTRTSMVWAVANGGHDDYHGNEINRIGLEADAPAWTEHYRSSSGFTVPNDAPRYSDGKPASIHSYWSQQFIESMDMAMRFGLGSTSTIGFPKPNIDGFDATVAVGQDGWSDVSDFPSWPAFDTDTPVCKNTLTEDVYCFYKNTAVYKWTRATNQVSTVNNSPTGGIDANKAAPVFDPVRGRFFLANGAGAWTYDISTDAYTARTLSGAAASGVLTPQNGIIYEPERDSYLVLRVAGLNSIIVYEIDPDTFAVTTPSLTGSPPANPGTNGGGNAYGRFLYVPNLGGAIWFPTYAANGWFLRTH